MLQKILDKIKNYNNRKLILLISKTAFLAFIPLMIFVICMLPFYQTILMFIFMLLFGKFGAQVGTHRYFSHRSFQTSKTKEWLLAFFGTVNTSDTILNYVVHHHHHHSNSDEAVDTHSPKNLNWFQELFFLVPPERFKAIKPISHRSYLWKMKPVIFFHRWYWPTIAIYTSILALINPWLLLTCYYIPVGYSDFLSMMGRWPAHTVGYQNFDTKDNSKNSTLSNWLTLGEGLHNNHHHRPNEYNYAFANKKGEWDCVGWFIKKFMIK